MLSTMTIKYRRRPIEPQSTDLQYRKKQQMLPDSPKKPQLFTRFSQKKGDIHPTTKIPTYIEWDGYKLVIIVH